MLNKWREYRIIKNSDFFDPAYYLLNYPDVRNADIDPLTHFNEHGWREGRNPSQKFDVKYYVESNPDVRNSKVNPLFHYIRYGRKEGRKTTASSKERIPYYLKEPNNKIRLLRLITKNNFKRALTYLKMYGLPSFLKKIKAIMLSNKNDDDILQNDIPLTIHKNPFKTLPINIDDKLEQYSEKVSIIIPTKNAGDDFEFLLKVLKNQKGFKEIEIVIVDSGSLDNTLQIAEAYNAKIINILPEEFSHSYARNLGAENASGDYLLLTVQDALPPTETWLYELMTVLINNDVAAVSCAEFPREDADLFYRVISWNHYNFLGVNEKDKIFKLPSNPNYISLRQNGQLSNLACLMPRKIVMKYKYRLNYAEDLDLGIRLIKEGNKIAFLGLTRIIHSHNRPAIYFLKRGYVDNLFLSDMFSDFTLPMIKYDDVFSDIIFTYHFIMEEIINNISKLIYPVNFETFVSVIKETKKSINCYKYPLRINVNNKYIDDDFKAFLENNIFNISEYPKKEGIYSGVLINSLMGFINITFEYLNISYEVIDRNLSEEVKTCILKEFSLITGAHLAYCYKNSSVTEKKNFDKIHTALKEDI